MKLNLLYLYVYINIHCGFNNLRNYFYSNSMLGHEVLVTQFGNLKIGTWDPALLSNDCRYGITGSNCMYGNCLK